MPASLNGCGTTYYGSRDFHHDGSYITTEWIVFAYIPIFPLASFRVLPVGGDRDYLVFRSQNFSSQKIPLCLRQVRNTYLILLAIILSFVLLLLLASVNGPLALIYLVFLLSVFLFKRTYLGWYQNIARLTQSRNQFNQHSVKQQAREQQEAEQKKTTDGVLKVGEGTSSVLGVVLDEGSLSAGIIQNGRTMVIPN
jgi:hypothetical protein